MSFATPIALAWAALTIPLVVFYILKIRLRQAPVSTTIFWQQIFDEKRPRSLWQQLRHWLSLLVQIIWCILLVLALAEPYFNWEILQARRLILVIDNSASMNATDVAPTRLEAAKKAANLLVASLRFRDEVAVITAGTQPQVVCGLTGHERTLQTAIRSISKTDGPTRVSEAVELGKRLLGDAQHGQVVVYSDGGFAGSEKLADDKLVRLEPIGKKTPNVGITNFQVRRSLLDPVGYEILVELVNASVEAATCRLDLDLNGNPVDVFPLTLKPGEVWSQALEKTSVDGGHLTARLTPDDALAADNQAAAILPKRTTQKVLLISPGNLFLQKALEANSLVELNTAKELPKQFAAGMIHVFHRHVPKQLPPGQVLVIDPIDGCDFWQVAGPLENPIVTKQDVDSPLMRHVRLDNIILPQARKLTPRAGTQTLVGAVEGDPLYFSFEEPGRKLLVLTVNLDEGDLTFRTAFPIMVTNALGWFAGQSGELRESLVAGAISEIELPVREKSAPPLVLRFPNGRDRPLPAISSKVSVGPLDEVGIWTINEQPEDGAKIHQKAEPVLEIACNLATKSESELSIPESWQAQSVIPVAAAGWFVRPIWFYLAACAWVLAIGEWFLYQRRWIS
ncbi:MAG: VWA domain-containing protein [Pirellulaceae bacterium]|nr:VWA domain-containing protein [Pirellulaceae bacterium]